MQTGLSSAAGFFLDIRRAVFKKGVKIVVLEIWLSEKALMKVELMKLRNRKQQRKVRITQK